MFKQTKAMQRMLKARESVARKNPFFASILFGANLVETTHRQTIQTNGRDIYFNAGFVEAQENDRYIEGLLLKTIIHCAFLHVGRKRWREEKMWNDACSFPVNDVVGKYFPLHPEALVHPQWGQMSPEAVYELLQQQQEKQGGGGQGDGKGKSGKGKPQPGQGKGKGNGNPQDEEGQGEGGEGDQDQQQGGGGGHQPQDGEGDQESPGGMFQPSPEEAEEAEQEWRRNLANAIEKSQKAGTMPGSLSRLITELFPKEKLDWRDLIRDMSRDAKAKTSRTWSRPNRRRLGGGEMMPGYGNDNVYKLVLCLDVSGSVNDEMKKQMAAEAASLLDQDLVNHVTLISVDTMIQSRLEATSSEDVIGWDPRGGGGTDFRTAMAEVRKMTDVIGCVFLTDMATNSFGEQPDFPVVWVNWEPQNGIVAPYGRTVPY